MFKKICNILLVFIVLAALGLAAVLGIPLLMGNNLYAVTTESMLPTYKVGDVVVVKPVRPEEIKVGDAITFEQEEFKTVVTHRVVGIDAEAQEFTTQGDNNPNPDFWPTSFGALVGRVEYGIPYLGHLVTNIRTPEGLAVTVWLVVLVLMLLFLPDLLLRARGRAQQPQKRRKSTPNKDGKIVYSAGAKLEGLHPANGQKNKSEDSPSQPLEKGGLA